MDIDMDIEELRGSIRETLPPLFECAPAPREGVRVRTPLTYPDGGMVDVFVLARDGGYKITDFGQTLGWLRMQSAGARRSPGQNRMVEDVCETLGIELDHGQLILRAGPPNALGESVLRLAQAAVRVSDLWFTLRVRAAETAADEVSAWLLEKEIPFARKVKKQGRSGRNWTIDYQIRTAPRTSLIFLLSTGSRGAARQITEHALAGCFDLQHLKKDSQPRVELVSLFDDRADVWRAEDFRLMEQCSEVARWSRPDEFERILKAA